MGNSAMHPDQLTGQLKLQKNQSVQDTQDTVIVEFVRCDAIDWSIVWGFMDTILAPIFPVILMTTMSIRI
jgi:hypothetical protein